MIPDTQPDEHGLYWKNGKIYEKSSPWSYVVTIPAMIGTLIVLAWGIFTASAILVQIIPAVR